MGQRNFGYMLRQLRSIERQQNRDLTDQALAVLAIEHERIAALPISQQQRDEKHALAIEQWQTFMQRSIEP